MNILFIIVLYFGFISLGLPDQILGVAWPDMRRTFNLPLDHAGIIIIAVSLCTTISSFLSGYLLRRFSISSILIASAALTSFGMLLYGSSPYWWLIILATIPLGLGAGAIDSVLNDYVSKNLTSRHMNFLHGFWGIGATLGPAIMTLCISLTHSWRVGYITIGMVQFVLLTLFFGTRKMWKKTNTKTEVSAKEPYKLNLFTPAPLTSVLLFFVYCALEGSIGVWFYSILTEFRGVNKGLAGAFIVVYWCSLTVGRFVLGWLSEKMNCSKTISFSTYGVLLGTILLFFDNSLLTLLALMITGASLSGIYPCMMFETSYRFESRAASVLTGYQVGFACLGYALLVPLVGMIIENFGLALFVPILILMAILLIIMDKFLHKILKLS